MTTCQCGREVRRNGMGYQKYCSRCKQRARRRGDSKQEPLRRKELRPWRKRATALLRRAKNREEIEAVLRHNHNLLLDIAEEQLADMNSYGPSYRGPSWKRQAYEALKRAVVEADAVESGLLCAAMFLIEKHEPRRFSSRRAFEFELVRAWRSLGPATFGTAWRAGMTHPKRYYRDLQIRAVEELARILVTTFSAFGGFIVRADTVDLTAQTTARNILHQPVELSPARR